MNTKKTEYIYLYSKIIFVIFYLILNAGCTKEIVRHGFSFNAGRDSPNILILDYRYGSSKHPGMRTTQKQRKKGRASQTASVFGDMKIGGELYVKWKVKSSGAVYEDTVNLKKILPSHITRHKIRFIIRGTLLHVYLISPYKLRVNPCPSWEKQTEFFNSKNPDDKIFSSYCNLRVYKLYPRIEKIESAYDVVRSWMKYVDN